MRFYGKQRGDTIIFRKQTNTQANFALKQKVRFVLFIFIARKKKSHTNYTITGIFFFFRANLLTIERLVDRNTTCQYKFYLLNHNRRIH